MPSISKALVVGGGIGGMTSAISLTRIGVETYLLDIDPQWRVYGAGITITGPTLRALKAVGVLDRVMAEGYTAEHVNVCDIDGQVISQIKTEKLEDADIPGAGGILRPVLHNILSEKTRAAGVNIRLGKTITKLIQNEDAVKVTLSDGTEESYDFVVGADGIYSNVRQLLFPASPLPRYTGQSCWRLLLPRSPQIDRRHFFLGGPVKVGLTPVSQTQMYMFLLHHTPEKPSVTNGPIFDGLRQLMVGYGGILSEIRESLGEESQIVYRPLETILIENSWSLGRAVIIGDAAHATTPQLASGAGMAVEDGLVLGEELGRNHSVRQAMDAFGKRRYDRAKMVVRNSLRIGELEVTGAPAQEQTAIVQESLAILCRPY